jgi:hypothetical protein
MTTTTDCLGCAIAADQERVTCAHHHQHPPEILTWDWREQPDLSELASIVLERSGGRIHLTPVEDTGDDQYALIIGSEPLTQEQASAAYWAEVER